MIKTNCSNDSVLFQHLIEEIKDYAIFMIDGAGIIVTWNPGVKRLLGYDEEEFIGKPFSAIFSDDDVKVNVPEAELRTAETAGKAEDERWHRRKDGSTFWASGLVTLMKDNGRVIGFAKIMRDQTQKKRFEEQLADQANALALANRELTNFAGVVSHDLNAPLQTVYGFANILKENPGLDSEAEVSVHHIVDGTKHMIKLVNDLLQYTVDTKDTSAVSFVDTAVLLKTILRGLEVAIREKNVTVQADALPTVWADETQLGRVFQNLIENGIKYSCSERVPEIKVRAQETDSETIFSVEDNGRGISEHEINRLFTLFERLDSTAVLGNGIGLATCRKVVERLGGRIWVNSKVNQGSVFSFAIPHRRETIDGGGTAALSRSESAQTA